MAILNKIYLYSKRTLGFCISIPLGIVVCIAILILWGADAIMNAYVNSGTQLPPERLMGKIWNKMVSIFVAFDINRYYRIPYIPLDDESSINDNNLEDIKSKNLLKITNLDDAELIIIFEYLGVDTNNIIQKTECIKILQTIFSSDNLNLQIFNHNRDIRTCINQDFIQYLSQEYNFDDNKLELDTSQEAKLFYNHLTKSLLSQNHNNLDLAYYVEEYKKAIDNFVSSMNNIEQEKFNRLDDNSKNNIIKKYIERVKINMLNDTLNKYELNSNYKYHNNQSESLIEKAQDKDNLDNLYIRELEDVINKYALNVNVSDFKKRINKINLEKKVVLQKSQSLPNIQILEAISKASLRKSRSLSNLSRC